MKNKLNKISNNNINVISLIYQTTKTGTGYPNTIEYEKIISIINGIVIGLWIVVKIFG